MRLVTYTSGARHSGGNSGHSHKVADYTFPSAGGSEMIIAISLPRACVAWAAFGMRLRMGFPSGFDVAQPEAGRVLHFVRHLRDRGARKQRRRVYDDEGACTNRNRDRGWINRAAETYNIPPLFRVRMLSAVSSLEMASSRSGCRSSCCRSPLRMRWASATCSAASGLGVWLGRRSGVSGDIGTS